LLLGLYILFRNVSQTGEWAAGMGLPGSGMGGFMSAFPLQEKAETEDSCGDQEDGP